VSAKCDLGHCFPPSCRPFQRSMSITTRAKHCIPLLEVWFASQMVIWFIHSTIFKLPLAMQGLAGMSCGMVRVSLSPSNYLFILLRSMPSLLNSRFQRLPDLHISPRALVAPKRPPLFTCIRLDLARLTRPTLDYKIALCHHNGYLKC
jgi:hypothetical protein